MNNFNSQIPAVNYGGAVACNYSPTSSDEAFAAQLNADAKTLYSLISGLSLTTNGRCDAVKTEVIQRQLLSVQIPISVSDCSVASVRYAVWAGVINWTTTLARV